jgi:hypothetical protein
MNAAASSGARNSTIADGRWHSFGGAQNSLAANTHSVSSSRPISSSGVSRVSSSALTNSALGRNTFEGSRLGGTTVSSFGRPLGSAFVYRGYGGFGSRGCWNCGWGFGFGFGWGYGWGWPWPYWGFGWGYPGLALGGYWAPYWYQPWWGWSNYDFGYYTDNPSGGYGDNSTYSASPYSLYDFNGGSAPAESDQSSQFSPDTNWNTGNIAESTPTVLLYLKDGTMYVATNYWLSGNKLHYVVSYGGEGTVDMDQVDLQRTVNENAKRGVRFSPSTTYSFPTSAASAASFDVL